MLAGTAAIYGIDLSRESAIRLSNAREGTSDALRRSPHTVSLDDEPATFDAALLAAADRGTAR